MSKNISIIFILRGSLSTRNFEITGKYCPIHQWICFVFSEIVENLGENVDRNLKNSIYDAQIQFLEMKFKKN